MGWSRVELVGVHTVSSLISGVCSLWLGSLADRHGTRLLVTASAFLAGACLISISVDRAPWQFYLAWAGFGVAIPGLMTIGPNAAIANWFIRKRALAYTFYTFGSATAGIVLAPLFARIADQAGWRAAWMLMGLLVWIVVPFAWFSIRRPEDVGLLPDGGLRSHGEIDSPVQVPPPTSAVAEAEWNVGEALRHRSFWLLTLAFMLTSLPASSIFVHMSAYVATKGFNVAEGATAVSIYGFGVRP